MHFGSLPSWKSGKKAGFLALVMVVALSMMAASVAPANWTSSGQSIVNWRSQPLETSISAKNVNKLTPAFVVNTDGDVSATPNISNGIAYFPDWGGSLWAVNSTTGAVVWKVSLATVSGVSGALSRATPTSAPGGFLIVPLQNGGWLLKINQRDGSVVWKTQLSSHFAAVLTQSPAVFKGVIYEGVSSGEEFYAANPAYPCCTFRGSMNAIDAATGQILWQTYMVPNNSGVPGGFSGGSIWGSTPVVDPARNAVYIGTGNNYTVPDSVATCTVQPCNPPDNLVDAVVALDMTSGAVKWADPLLGLTYDAWNVACFSSQTPGNCPSPAGPDYDFGQGPMKINAGGRDLLAIGQKSGMFWAIDPNSGTVVWSTNGGPGSALGGMEWGSATDGTRIYYALGNSYGIPYTYTRADGSTGQTNAGLWGALDPLTGKILWQTPDPNGAIDTGAVSVANGVVYGGSMGNPVGGPNGAAKTNPTYFALNGANGAILWQYASGGSVNAGAAIANGMVYWGSGYGHFGLGDANPQFYGFKLGK